MHGNERLKGIFFLVYFEGETLSFQQTGSKKNDVSDNYSDQGSQVRRSLVLILFMLILW